MSTIDHKTLLEAVHYDPDTGAFTWRERPRSHFNSQRAYKAWNAKFPGRPAGSGRGNGYHRVCIAGYAYHAHRLAWFYVHKEWPEFDIDHINHNPGDNRIGNLRAVTRLVNKMNTCMYKNNTSGVTGVSWSKRSQKWLAMVTLKGKAQYLGLYESLFDAVSARKSAESLYGFHENHGK